MTALQPFRKTPHALNPHKYFPATIPRQVDIGFIGLPGNCCREVFVRVERVGHFDHSAAIAFSIKIARSGDWQLAADELAFDIADKTDLLVQQIVFVADEHNDWGTSVVKPAGRPLQYSHIVSGGGVRNDYQIVFAQPEQAPPKMQ